MVHGVIAIKKINTWSTWMNAKQIVWEKRISRMIVVVFVRQLPQSFKKIINAPGNLLSESKYKSGFGIDLFPRHESLGEWIFDNRTCFYWIFNGRYIIQASWLLPSNGIVYAFTFEQNRQHIIIRIAYIVTQHMWSSKVQRSTWRHFWHDSSSAWIIIILHFVAWVRNFIQNCSLF
mgnify:FL=1